MNPWIDISQPLDNKIAVWPGDTPFTYKVNWSKEESGSVNVGQIKMSTHTGTHIDAPFHFDNEGKKVIDLDVNLYIGPAKVIHLPKPTSIGIKELSDYELDGVTRLLIRTDSLVDRQEFPSAIPEIEPELASYLAGYGVRLIGLDLPSVDPIDSKELTAHHELTRHGIHILEGLVLEQIEPGEYELAALPLPLIEADGSPVRAVVRKI
ncbi:arylformamidase [Bacillus salipaludis]|uniref:Kynurenine formamidase n=1 Tax=Bacillus salipaludis TaxID=2547811 RepID=A0A4R5VV83_9BACI|nr:arylformamidase [Bacillus salipaludis]MDQ6600525.1 arylformamidase [Bacillus salipaludis]TDK62084.1 arylformamidase [Bacillus salipaludis]